MEQLDNIFKIQQSRSRPYEFKNNVLISVTYEHELDLTVIDRQVYSVLDWLGDVGGLAEALMYIGTFALAVLHYGQFDAMLVNELYLASKKPERPEGSSNKV